MGVGLIAWGGVRLGVVLDYMGVGLIAWVGVRLHGRGSDSLGWC